MSWQNPNSESIHMLRSLRWTSMSWDVLNAYFGEQLRTIPSWIKYPSNTKMSCMGCFSRMTVTYNSIPLHSIILWLRQGLLSWWMVLIALHVMIPFMNINIQREHSCQIYPFWKTRFFFSTWTLYCSIGLHGYRSQYKSWCLDSAKRASWI